MDDQFSNLKEDITLYLIFFILIAVTIVRLFLSRYLEKKFKALSIFLIGSVLIMGGLAFLQYDSAIYIISAGAIAVLVSYFLTAKNKINSAISYLSPKSVHHDLYSQLSEVEKISCIDSIKKWYTKQLQH
ncbi:MAG: hypothetical protein ACK40G_12430 [Cytophagaceae bacterium]